MKITLGPENLTTLHLETDDGIHACAIVDTSPERMDRRKIRHRGLLSATGLLTAAVVESVNDMFRVVDLRRKQEPAIGALMKRRDGTGDIAVVTQLNIETRELWFDDTPRDAGIPWANVEYAS